MRTTAWPLFDIRLTTPDLDLRPLTEADLPLLAEITPEDYELSPTATTYAGLSEAESRGAVVHQEYWRALGGWRPDSWSLPFGVHLDGRLVGMQGLEGEDFPTLRTVDSFSFLAPGVRGRGLGQQMRAAVLAMAFGGLGARHAVTSAWADNHASLGVSRALGYLPNGVSPHRRGAGAGEMAHLRLSREDWERSGWPARVGVTGVERCLPFFGLIEAAVGRPAARPGSR